MTPPTLTDLRVTEATLRARVRDAEDEAYHEAIIGFTKAGGSSNV